MSELVKCRFRNAIASASLVAVTGIAAVSAAHAQTGDQADPRRQGNAAKVTAQNDADKGGRVEDDSERMSDSYKAKGIEMGAFLFLPKLEVDETYNSNVYSQRHDPKHDYITTVRPEMKLRSRFIEHEINLGMVAEQYLYKTWQDDNRTDLQFDVDGRFDFTSETQANHFSQLNFKHEDRGSPDATNGVEPTKTFSSINRTGLQHKAGRVTLLSEAMYDRREYGNSITSNGTVTDNSDRDRWEYGLRQRGGYELFPGYSALIEVSGNTHRFDKSSDRNGFNRNSKGYRAETGVGVDISKLVRGDFLVGYMQQDYEDRSLKDPKGLSWRASFNYTPTKLTSIIPGIERSLTDTTTSSASALLTDNFTLTVRHELARNIVLTGYGAAARNDLQGINGQDFWTYESRFRGTYAFTPELFAGGEVAYKTKDPEQPSSGYSQTTVMLRLGVQY